MLSKKSYFEKNTTGVKIRKKTVFSGGEEFAQESILDDQNIKICGFFDGLMLKNA